LAHSHTPEATVAATFQRTYQRPPTGPELAEALGFVQFSNDQSSRTATIQETAAEEDALPCNSQDDITPDAARRLTAWEQLAQVLLCANEFQFVD
jgi:hypothetical protein